MRHLLGKLISLSILLTAGFEGWAAPPAARTTVLGPFTGHEATLHPDNLRPRKIQYYGTDLGWTYEHAGELQILFGDTWATREGAPIQASTRARYDDGFGTIDLAQWRDGSRITSSNIPLIRLGQNEGTDEMSAIDPGVPMEGLKTPVGGFSNGLREFALFVTGKPVACRANAECERGLVCETQLGYFGEPAAKAEGLTFPCAEGRAGCNADTMSDSGKPSGFCVDRGSSLWDNSGFGHVGAVAMRQLIAMRSTSDRRVYSDVQPWVTNRFINAAIRKAKIGGEDKVLIWGRPWFVGANSTGRSLSLYFAYVEMPLGPGLQWRPKYFIGIDTNGSPRFSGDEHEAAALDLDATRDGVQAGEKYDLVNQMSVSWVEPLKKWVMFYGGGIVKAPIATLAPRCGVLQVFARSECDEVALDNGAIRMRVADTPWGPWSPPQDLIVGGDADQRPTADQYGPHGVLYHPQCSRDGCAQGTPRKIPGDYGWLYGANIIEEWTQRVGAGADLLWNASTWNPYRVILLRTHIDP